MNGIPEDTQHNDLRQFAKFLAIGGHRVLTRRTQGSRRIAGSDSAVLESTRKDATPETLEHQVGMAVLPPEPSPKVGDDCEQPVSPAQVGDSHKPYIQQGP